MASLSIWNWLFINVSDIFPQIPRKPLHVSCMCVLVAQSLSDSVTPWTVARQAPLSMEFCRQEYWTGLPFPSPYISPTPWKKNWLIFSYLLCHSLHTSRCFSYFYSLRLKSNGDEKINILMILILVIVWQRGHSHMPLVRECTMFLEDRYIKIFKKNCDFFKIKV